jgi:hypothetical protein
MANGERADRVRQAVAEYVRSKASGKEISLEAWAASHADLMPELADELKKVQRIGAACEKLLDGASPAAIDTGSPSLRTPSRMISRSMS